MSKKLSPELIVGIGASAGGLDALQRFFKSMMPNRGYAYIVIQHLSPDFKSVMDEILSRHTSMEIFNVEDGMEVEPDCIYLIPPKKEMLIKNGILHLTERDYSKSVNLPIDAFFSSLAKDQKKKAVGIILSGTGSDGSRGAVEIHEKGGFLIAQDEGSASFVGMPRVAVATGVIDYIVPPEEMPEILNFRKTLGSNKSGNDKAINVALLGSHLPLFRILREEFGIDFSSYKQTTISRRIERRAEMLQMPNVQAYIQHAQKNHDELEALYRDLLIGVTQFFRDPEAFAFLSDHSLPDLIEKAGDNEIRVWVAGCASGEEAYSIAIALSDKLDSVGKRNPVKIFATDAHSQSISAASSGQYSEEAVEALTQEQIQKYFTPTDTGYKIQESIRQMIVFAQHNLLSDPPFNNVHLLTCRNLLIYLTPEAQNRALSLFHYALNLGGTLFLGPSETLGKLESYFMLSNKTWRIYEKTQESPTTGEFSRFNSTRKKSSFLHAPSNLPTATPTEKRMSKVYSLLMESHLNPGLLINDRREIVHTFGDIGHILKPLHGAVNLDVLAMFEGNLKIALSASLIKSVGTTKPVHQKNIQAKENDPSIRVSFSVFPIKEGKVSTGYHFITFTEEKEEPTVEHQELDSMSSNDTFDAQSELVRRITELESELKFTKENLQCMVEEVETSNEELQSSNEELLASNEELQSTNEELHSVNEELYTVNAEYEKKNVELVQLNHDIDNILRSTDIGTVFVDNQLRIRKFTPAIALSFNLISQDIGRPIDHFSYNILGHDGLIAEIKAVIKSGNKIEREVRETDGKWLLLRILPFMGAKKQMEGAVITFIDISEVKKSEKMIAEQAHQLSLVNKDLESFAYSVSHDLQAPLRTAEGFIKLLIKRHRDQLEANAQEYIDFIRDSNKSMYTMINHILEYTRVQSKGQAFIPVDTDQLLQSVLDDLNAKISKRGAIIEKDALPSVQGDKDQLSRVFYTLLDNALTHTGSNPIRIGITCKTEEERMVVSVQDNGPGLGSKDTKNLFKILGTFGKNKRPSPEKARGLPLAKRIILRHQGDLWVDQSKEQGTVFSFSLPKSMLVTDSQEVAKISDTTSS